MNVSSFIQGCDNDLKRLYKLQDELLRAAAIATSREYRDYYFGLIAKTNEMIDRILNSIQDFQ